MSWISSAGVARAGARAVLAGDGVLAIISFHSLEDRHGQASLPGSRALGAIDQEAAGGGAGGAGVEPAGTQRQAARGERLLIRLESTGGDDVVKRSRPFLVLWSLAVVASVAAFVLHLGCAAARFSSATRWVGSATSKRDSVKPSACLELEVASFQNPQRVEMIAKTLLGMQAPTPDRIIPMRAVVDAEDQDKTAA